MHESVRLGLRIGVIRNCGGALISLGVLRCLPVKNGRDLAPCRSIFGEWLVIQSFRRSGHEAQTGFGHIALGIYRVESCVALEVEVGNDRGRGRILTRGLAG